MNTLKYVQAIVDATGISGETLGAVRMGIQLAVNDEAASRAQLLNGVAYVEALLSEKASQAERLQGLEDRLLAWLDEHSKDLPIVLAEDYDQYLADVIVEVLNQQHVTIRTQHEALAAQKEAISRLRQEQPITLHRNGNGQVVAQTEDSAASRNGLVIVLPDEADNHVVMHPEHREAWQRILDNAPVMDARKSDPIVPADWPHGEALYVELHRLAVNGAGPSKPRYNIERASGMPTADEITAKTGQRWFALLKQAGLKAPIRSNHAVADEAEAAPDGDATFRA